MDTSSRRSNPDPWRDVTLPWFVMTLPWYVVPKGQERHGVVVGAGRNLYPVFAMLPSCERLTLIEYSHDDIEDLDERVRQDDDAWERLWPNISPYFDGRDFAWGRDRLLEIATVHRGTIFEDPPAAEFNAGTLYFSAALDEERRFGFQEAIDRFLRMLKSNAPYIAYTDSEWWWSYDAFQVGGLRAHLNQHTTFAMVRRLGVRPDPAHAGSTAGVLAHGLA